MKVDHWGVTDLHLHPQFPVDDQNAFVFHIDMIDQHPFLSFLVLIHERFHQYQFDHFSGICGEAFRYSEHLNIENLTMMQLEEMLLIDFLQVQPQRKLELLKDFLAVHRERRKLLESNSIAWEDDQMRMEGLADYVAARSGDAFSLFEQFDGMKHVASSLNQHRWNEDPVDYAIKWRHYGVGAGMAYALDFLDVPNWKVKVEAGARLSELLAEALVLSDTEITLRFDRIKTGYGFNRIREELGKRINAYQLNVAQTQKEYQELSGIPVVIQKPQGHSLSGGGMSFGGFYFPDGSVLSLKDTSYLASDDGDWSLHFSEIPFLFQLPSGEQEFKVEETVVVTMDGRSCHLRDLLRLQGERSFRTLTLKGKSCELHVGQVSGLVQVRKGKLLFSFS